MSTHIRTKKPDDSRNRPSQIHSLKDLRDELLAPDTKIPNRVTLQNQTRLRSEVGEIVDRLFADENVLNATVALYTATARSRVNYEYLIGVVRADEKIETLTISYSTNVKKYDYNKSRKKPEYKKPDQ